MLAGRFCPPRPAQWPHRREESDDYFGLDWRTRRPRSSRATSTSAGLKDALARSYLNSENEYGTSAYEGDGIYGLDCRTRRPGSTSGTSTSAGLKVAPARSFLYGEFIFTYGICAHEGDDFFGLD